MTARTAPPKRLPTEAMALLVKHKISFEFVADRHNRNDPGRQPYWGVYVSKEEIPSSLIVKLGEAGFQLANGALWMEGRWS